MGRPPSNSLNARAEQVLALLRSSPQALGAYELVHRLSDKGERIAPTQIYRVLGTLKDAGLILRVESRNAFIAAHHVHAPNEPIALLVCACCGKVEEADIDFVSPTLVPAAAAFGFKPYRTSLEVVGECGICRDIQTVLPITPASQTSF